MSPEPDPPRVKAPAKTSPIRCAECDRTWHGRHEHWRAYVAMIDGKRVVGLFCPECAAREFEDA